METKSEVILQNILFPVSGVCMEEALYYRQIKGVKKIEKNGAEAEIVFSKNGKLNFDTYFNAFSLGKWVKYTNIDNVGLAIKIKGDFIIKLTRQYKSGRAQEVLIEGLDEQICASEDIQLIKLKIPYLQTVGSLCFELTARQEGSSFFGGWFFTEVENTNLCKIKIGVNICTYKREKYINNNLGRFSKAFFGKDSLMREAIEIFISDNSNTLKDCEWDKNIHIVSNKNTGGAGGFTRGLIEILKSKHNGKFTHVIFMDDDIIVDPESIFRTYSFLRLMKKEFSDAQIGGAMLRLDRQYIMHENGSYWDNGIVYPLKQGLDLRSFEATLYSEFEETTNYNAWWYCVVPLDSVTLDNLPLPLFIRGDDVEFGLRNCKSLILVNGICVWHEPFEFKYSSMLKYYIFRNQCIVNSIHKTLNKKVFLKSFKEAVIYEILRYRYKNARLLIRGVQDFLKGIDWLKEQDGEKLNMEISGQGYKIQPVQCLDFPFFYPQYEKYLSLEDEKKRKRLFRRATFNGLFLRTNSTIGYAPMDGSRPIQFYRAKNVLNYNYNSNSAFITSKNIRESVVLLFELLKIINKVNSKIVKVSNEFAKRYRELTNLTFWERYLSLNGDKKNN